MDQEKFIDGIKIAVVQSAIHSTIRTLEAPSGRQPNTLFIELSKWYNELNEEEKRKVKSIIEIAVERSVFGFLSVIDGVRAVTENSDDEEGAFKLSYVTGDIEYVLNDPNKDYLHDIYNA